MYHSMAKSKKSKYYVVWEGHNPGIYESWNDCQLQIKGYPGAKYKSFKSLEAARAAFHGNYDDFTGPAPKTEELPETIRREINWDGLAVDAACSGNPGRMEYQGVFIGTGEQLFHEQFALGTNNIGEFLAIVHALAHFKRLGDSRPVYSDSAIAMKWVRAKKCRTKLRRDSETERLYRIIERAETWLQNHDYPNELLKWKTERWGEIPADFGRK